MTIAEMLQLIAENKLTCSIVAELFAQSPYAQQGEAWPDGSGKRFPNPHAHMHLRDGFEILPPPPTAAAARLQAYNVLDVAKKKKVWEQAHSQLYPEDSVQNVALYGSTAEKLALKDATEIGMDKNMLAHDHMYNRRSGVSLAGVPPVTRTDQYVKVPVMGKKGMPDRVLAPNQADPLDLASWGATAYEARLAQDGVSEHGRIKANWLDKPTVVTLARALPPVNSNPHSMFEDSESAIMTLTAALKSKAGIAVLNALVGQPRELSFAIQSRTSDRALPPTVTANATTNTTSGHSKRASAVKMIDRAQQLNPADRSFTGVYDQTAKDITFTCTILSVINTNEILIVTHYPLSGDMTCRPASAPLICDLAETSQTPTGGVFVPFDLDDPLPSLTW